MIDLIIKNAKVATASDVFSCDIGIDKEKIVAKYENGTLKITLTKCNSDNITSNININ